MRTVIIFSIVLTLLVFVADGKKRRKFHPERYGHPRPGPHPPLIGRKNDKDKHNQNPASKHYPGTGAFWKIPPGLRMVPFRQNDFYEMGTAESGAHKTSVVHSEPYSGEYIRLRGNISSFNAGRIEVYRGGRWGIVCDDDWDVKDASVACKQLGFKQGALSSPLNSYYGIPSADVEILMDNMKCKGSESRLQSCIYTTLHDCSNTEAASVICKTNEGCEDGWVAWDGSCYKFFGGANNLKQAIEKCASIESGLVTIETVAENNFLSNVLKLTAQDSHVWYTAGKRMKKDWKWFKISLTSTLRSPHRRTNRRRALRLSKVAMDVEKWFPGWGDIHYAKEPVNSRRYYCLALTDMFQHPNGSRVQLDYFYWAAKICANRISKFDFICEKKGMPEPEECYHSDNGSEYRGFQSVTDKATLCLNWTDSRLINPETHPDRGLGQHNLCRNPDGDAKPWCWVDHIDIKFGFCSVPSCNDTIEINTPEVPDCPDNQFYCSQEKICIKSYWRCDGEQDCTFGEDENECVYAVNDFRVSEKRVLTGYENRVDYINSTLEFCAKKCVEIKEFVCKSFCYGKHVANCFLSDGNLQNGRILYSSHYDYYEMKSQTVNCSGQFMCNNGKCIPNIEVCNGQDNCNDFSDEDNCETAAPIEVRLVGGDEHSGRLEIKYMGEWGTVCKDLWDIQDSRVVCRMLQYPGAERYTGMSNFGFGSGNILLTNVQCIGNETSLEECIKSPWRQHDCKPYDSVGVICRVQKVCDSEQFLCGNGNCIRGTYVCDAEDDCEDNTDEINCKITIELVNGTRPSEGRVEIIQNGIRGTVCDDDWSDLDANVICKQIGYQSGGRAINKAKFGEGSGIIWLDNVHCVGIEDSIKDCDTPEWGVHDCSHSEDAGVVCFIGSETQTDFRLELVDGDTPNEGRVEIVLNGDRGTICDDSWDDKDADVVCRMLGYKNGGKAHLKAKFGSANKLKILTDEVGCLGTENSLEECRHSHWYEHDCDHKEDAGVHCYIETGRNDTAAKECGLRPFEYSSSRGRVKRELEMPIAQKIVGGDLVEHGKYPWQVGIRKIYNVYDNGDMTTGHWCGGTIISDSWILSAAHCFTGLRKNQILVKVGDHHHKKFDTDEQVFTVEKLIPHEHYDHQTHDYDVALIKIKLNKFGKKIEFSDYVQPACLPPYDAVYEPGNRCLISGWGDLGSGQYPDLLRAAVVPLISRAVCHRLYRNDITTRMLCAGYIEGGIDTCQGDSGGPLVCKINNKYTLMGVTSFGNGCAQPNAPGVYARVTSFIDWINDKVK